jgi:hypothetical protein
VSAPIRDVPGEAQAWRQNVRHPILAEMISALDAETLTAAYLTWWQTYTRCVRKAPSNRMGISSADAAEAGETANRAVRGLLSVDHQPAD